MQQADFQAFANALADVQAELPPGLLPASGTPLPARFAVYRNNVYASLTEALCENFPITQALVGKEFFRAMARTYVQGHIPSHAQLHQYGNELPQFIAGFDPAKDLPYLTDITRLEIAWRESWAAADAPALILAALGTCPADLLLQARVTAHPAARLVRSRWPIASIWQAHQTSEPDLSALSWNAESVLVTRPDAQINLVQLPADLACFADSLLLQQLPIEDAAAATLAIHPDINVGKAIGALLDAGAITEILTP